MCRVQSKAALEVVVGLPCCGWLQQRALNLGLSDVRDQPRGNRAHDLVLYREHVIETSVVALGPEMGTGGRIHQLHRDAHPILATPDTALQGVTHSQLAPDLARHDHLSF